MEEKKDYSVTLNLPKTEFEMRGNLPKKEPGILEKMLNDKVYYLALEKNKNTGKTFVLHDGPPYANGDIHAGHSLDKILKDIIIRYKTMNGFYSPYVPGWDTHGLPIEKKVQQDLKVTKDEVGVSKFREICKEYALDAVERTAKQFERLGGLGDYKDKSKRYLTLHQNFEAAQIGVFGDMYKKGYMKANGMAIHMTPIIIIMPAIHLKIFFIVFIFNLSFGGFHLRVTATSSRYF